MVLLENDSIRPEDLTTPTQAKILFYPLLNDTVRETKRPTKNGKGEFSQWSIPLEIDNEEVEFRFLMGNQFKSIKKKHGLDTALWRGKNIVVYGKKDDAGYWKWVLE
jgi:hypothetical protein